jgi:hypothetical protein
MSDSAMKTADESGAQRIRVAPLHSEAYAVGRNAKNADPADMARLGFEASPKDKGDVLAEPGSAEHSP